MTKLYLAFVALLMLASPAAALASGGGDLKWTPAIMLGYLASIGVHLWMHG